MSISVEASDSWAYSGSSAQTESFTCPAGTDLLVVAITVYDVGTGAESHDLTPDALTYDSGALSQAVENEYPTTSRQRHSSIYYLANPTTGSALDLYYDPASNTRETMMSAFALSGCDTSDPIGATHTADLADTDMVESVTTTYDDSILIAAAVIGRTADIDLTEDANTVEVGYTDWDTQDYDSSQAAGYRLVGSAGAYDIGWTASVGQQSAFAAAEIKEESTPPVGGSIISLVAYNRMMQEMQ